MRRRNPTLLVVGIIFVLMLAGCGPSQGDPPPEPLALVEAAADTIQQAETFAVSIEKTGAPITIDPNGIIEFTRATGQYVAPDRVQATVRVLFQGLASDIEVIAIGNDQYFRHTVLTAGQWLNAEFSPGFNAEYLVRSESGLARAMSAISGLTLVGDERINGVATWHLTGTAAGNEVAALTIGLIPAEADVLVDLYIRQDNGKPERMVIVQPDTISEEHPEPSTWTVEIYDFNGDYAVDVPS